MENQRLEHHPFPPNFAAERHRGNARHLSADIRKALYGISLSEFSK